MQILGAPYEKTLTDRGKVLLKEIKAAGVEHATKVARRLRKQQLQASDLPGLSDAQLKALFPTIGAYNRMKRFIVRLSWVVKHQY